MGVAGATVFSGAAVVGAGAFISGAMDMRRTMEQEAGNEKSEMSRKGDNLILNFS
jgi:hypothetical protein